MRRKFICAQCAAWARKGVPAEQSAQGIGHCLNFDRPQEYKETFCVLFNEDRRNRASRRAWIEQYENKKEQQ